MITKANVHLGFNCRDLEKSVKFYTEILGCKEAFTLYYGDLIPDNPEWLAKMDPVRLEELTKLKDEKWIVYLEWADGYFIELFNEVNAYIEIEQDSTHNFGYTHFAFIVDDVHEFYNGLIEKGVEDCIELKPEPSIDGNCNMWFHDPDGNRIEVQQYTERSMQITGEKRKSRRL